MDAMLADVYGELRGIAHRQLRAEPDGHTLSTTAVVHEAYLRLSNQDATRGANRAQFLALASRTMRRVLIDYARQHLADRRGGSEVRHISLDALMSTDAGALAVSDRADVLVALDDALSELAVLDARLARVVECRFFAGLTEQETSTVLGVSPRTVARDWLVARAWLRDALRDVDA